MKDIIFTYMKNGVREVTHSRLDNCLMKEAKSHPSSAGLQYLPCFPSLPPFFHPPLSSSRANELRQNSHSPFTSPIARKCQAEYWKFVTSFHSVVFLWIHPLPGSASYMLGKQSTFGDGASAIPAIATLFSLSRVIILVTEREGLTG